MGQLYAIQNQCTRKKRIEAARIATGATKLDSLEMLYQETGWEPLEKRRRKKWIIFNII